MLADPMIEIMAEYKRRYHEDVVYPTAARRAQQEAELRASRRSRRMTPDGPRVVRQLIARLGRFDMWSGNRGSAPSRS